MVHKVAMFLKLPKKSPKKISSKVRTSSTSPIISSKNNNTTQTRSSTQAKPKKDAIIETPKKRGETTGIKFSSNSSKQVKLNDNDIVQKTNQPGKTPRRSPRFLP